MLNDVLVVPELFFRVVCVEITDVVQVCPDPFQCIPGTVKRKRGCAILIKHAGARLDASGVAVRLMLHLFINRYDSFYHPFFTLERIDNDKVIVRAPNDKRIRSLFLQLVSDELQKVVSLFIPVLTVVIVHGDHVGIDQHRRFSGGSQGMDTLIRELVQIVEVGKACQGICVELIGFEQVIVLLSAVHGGEVCGQIGVGQQRKLRPVLHELPLPDGVNHMIAVGMPCAEDKIIVTSLVGKLITHTGDTPDIIRVKPLKLSVPEPRHGMLPVHANKLAEAVRNKEWDDLPVNELIVDQGSRLSFICPSDFLRKMIHDYPCLSCFRNSSDDHVVGLFLYILP